MADEITLQMEGNTCTISIPEDTYIGRVKIYAPRRQFPVLTHTKTTAAVHLLPGESMEVDAYGEGGEGDLLKTTFVLTEQGLVEQKSGISRDEVEVIVKPTTFNQQKAIEDYTELMRRIHVGAYSERSAEHHLTGTWPEDGVEESVFNLEELAASSGLEFFGNEQGGYRLGPMSEETRAARQAAQEYETPPGDDIESIEQHIQEINEQAESE